MRNIRFVSTAFLAGSWAMACAVALACASPAAAFAADYPTQPIKMVVPFAPGGGTDIVFRIISTALSKAIDQSIIVENRPGAGGSIGASEVARAAPDGYTLLGFHIALITGKHFQDNIPYDPIKSFTPIALVAVASNAVKVNPGLPAKDFAEFVALAKKEPGKLNYATTGAGGSDYLAGELLKKSTGTVLTEIPYRGGAPALAAAVAGDVQLTTGSTAEASALIRAGKLRALAVMQPQRDPVFPDIPSTGEFGYPDLNFQTWFGVWGPAGMPASVVHKISAKIKDVLNQKEVSTALLQAGFSTKYLPPDEFGKMTKNEFDRWNKVLGESKP
jgi:tripartite-type tricarboxylate transporter receptor subunit TctC